jgi:hypothetical protein
MVCRARFASLLPSRADSSCGSKSASGNICDRAPLVLSIHTGDFQMTRIQIVAVAAALAAALATPAMAQQSVANYGWNANNRAYVSDQQRNADWRRQRSYDSNAFWPGELAAGVVGGAIGTAGAIASAPFGGPYGYYDDDYARRNGFVCQPGTWFRDENGRVRPCQ